MVVAEVNMSRAIVRSVNLLSSTKDSLHVGWDVYDNYYQHVQGFKIRYQAEGSTIIQYSDVLNADSDNYGIEQLHENTYYKICVDVVTNFTDNSDLVRHQCIRATTSVDSLSVALGSTFGAFLALGIIVLFVFVAKWQHTRKLKKHLQSISQGDDAYDSMCQPDGDIEMSDVSMQVQEGTTGTTGQSGSAGTKPQQVVQNGEVTSKPDAPATDEDNDGEEILIDEAAAADMVPAMVSVGADGEVFVVPIDESGNVDESVMYPMDPSDVILIPQEQQAMLPSRSHKNPQKSIPTPPAIDPPPPNLKKRSSREAMMRDGTSSSSSTPNSTPSASSSKAIGSQPAANGSQRRDYGGARPKEYAGGDPRYKHAAPTQQLIDIDPPDPSSGTSSNNYSWPH